MAPPEKEQREQNTSPKGNVLKLLLPISVLLLLLIGGTAVWAVISRGSTAEDEDLELSSEADRVGQFWPTIDKDNKGLEVGGNLGGQDHAIHFTARIQFEVKYYHDKSRHAEAIAELDSLKAWIADVCRRKLALRTESAIHNEAEQQRIKTEIVTEVNKRLRKAAVRDVCFWELFTQ